MDSERSYAGLMMYYSSSETDIGDVGKVVNLSLINGEHPALVIRNDEGQRDVDLRHIVSVDNGPVDMEDLTAWWWRKIEAWCSHQQGGVGYKDRAACLAELKRLGGA